MEWNTITASERRWWGVNTTKQSTILNLNYHTNETTTDAIFPEVIPDGNIKLRIPTALLSVGNIYLCVNILFTWLTNGALVAVIILSPNLRTPPNNHLINICVNNLFLSVCMILSLVSINLNFAPDNTHVLFAGFQLFIVTNSFLQYWNSFTAICYYRLRTMRKPSLTSQVRKEIIHKSITTSWFVSVLLSLVFTLTSVHGSSNPMLTLSPLHYEFSFNSHSSIEKTSTKVLVMSLVIFAAYLVDLFLIITCYYRIFLVLDVARSCGRNRVSPWPQSSSTTETNDLTFQTTRRVYKPMENNWVTPYTVSENFIVHYQKRDNSLDFEETFALENPIIAEATHKRYHRPQLKPTLSNGSTISTRSKTAPDFSDISSGGELRRIRNIKNVSALRNQFLKKDRISLSSATKNSLVMLSAFTACSMPLFICSVPGIMAALSPRARLTALSMCRLLFYLNAPVYPTWYLFFSKRVRKCLARLIENITIYCKSRR